jgi:hypothetical protein
MWWAFVNMVMNLLSRKTQGISRLAEKLSVSQKGLDFIGFDGGYCVKTMS